MLAMKILSALELFYCQEYFHESLYKYKQSSDNVQSKRTVTASTLLTELCPFEFFPMKNHVHSVTLIPLRIFS